MYSVSSDVFVLFCKKDSWCGLAFFSCFRWLHCWNPFLEDCSQEAIICLWFQGKPIMSHLECVYKLKKKTPSYWGEKALDICKLLIFGSSTAVLFFVLFKNIRYFPSVHPPKCHWPISCFYCCEWIPFSNDNCLRTTALGSGGPDMKSFWLLHWLKRSSPLAVSLALTTILCSSISPNTYWGLMRKCVAKLEML